MYYYPSKIPHTSQSETNLRSNPDRVIIDFLRNQKFLVLDLFENHMEEISSRIEANLESSQLNTAQKEDLWKCNEEITSFIKGKSWTNIILKVY